MVLVVTVILVVTVVLLVTELIPVDLTALAVMVALMLAGVLAPRDALAGFANPAPITVGALFIVSAGLTRTGALDFLAARLTDLTEGRPRALLALVLALTGTLSAVINNTPVVVLMISVLMSACGRSPISLSKYLIPISFISILAGTSTLIGTSTNIIVSDLSVELGQDAIGMFELSPLGVPLALAGGALLFLLSFRLLPAHRTPICATSRDDARLYISELLVPPGSPLVGCDAVKGPCAAASELEVFEVLRGREVLDPTEHAVTLQEGDILLVRAAAADLVQVLDRKSVRLPRRNGEAMAPPFDDGALIVELIVPPNSTLVGRRWAETALAAEPHIHCIGVQRQWVHYPAQQIGQLGLTVGDILLVQSPLDHLEQLRADGDLIVVEDLHRQLVNRRKAPLAAVIFGCMIAAATTGAADILVAALAAAVLMIATRCLDLRQAYRAVDVRTLLLLVGTLALGRALQQSGAATLYAGQLLALLEGASPQIVLGGIIVLTSVLSHLLSNNATAVLVTPVALSAAAALGLSARPFIIGICFGASACYATPIGYQTNLLVYGPGGYRFVDYLKLGLPLDLLVCLGATLAIPWRWPF